METKKILLPILLLVCINLCLFACEKKKEGKVIVTEKEFNIRQDAEFNWVIDAKGKVRNVGEVDVKNVVVTGYCRSCGEVLVAGVWFINDVAKTDEQKDVISYLTARNEEEYSFREIAFFFNQSGQGPEGVLPDNIEVVIESFEVVDN
jgi:hypothetical protein